MKRLICVLLLALLVAGCNLLESQYCIVAGDGSSKYPHSVRTGAGACGDSTSKPSGKVVADTVLWVSAVEFPEDYEWRKDSSYGNVDAKILLYRDFQLVLSVPAGGNPAHDRHHIIGGELFSEYASDGQTVFCRDGNPYLEVGGAYTLAGFLESGGHEYVLTRPMAGSGFSFYRDGTLLISRSDAHLCGMLPEPAYSAGGSLYEDEGRCTFCYWTAAGNSGKLWYRVSGETESVLGDVPGDAVSVRMMDGRVVAASGEQGGMVWSEAAIWDVGFPVISGTCLDAGGAVCAVYKPYTSSSAVISHVEGTMYVSDEYELAVCLSGDGRVTAYGADGLVETISGSWRYIYPSCACLAGRNLLLALTPERLKSPSVVRWKGSDFNMEINGFITNVSYTIEQR